MHIVGDEKSWPIFVQAEAHVHRFRGGRGFVQHARIRQWKRGEIGDHGLKIKQRLEPSLRNFRLVWRVLRVPAGILKNVPQDHWRRNRVVIAHSDKRLKHFVFRGKGFNRGKRFGFALRVGKFQRFGQPDVGGNGLCDQLLKRCGPNGGEHDLLIRLIRPDVPTGEGVERLQSGSRAAFNGVGGYGVHPGPFG